MNIYIDESGSFVNAPEKGKWNVVAAVAAPESSHRELHDALRALKLSVGVKGSDECKLGALSEPQYLEFLGRLTRTQTILFATATDAGANDPARLAKHQQVQAAKIRENLPKMKYEDGRRGVEMLASHLESISPQLYAQLVCQVDLLYDVISRSINYYAQRIPGTLSAFRWRIDQKNTTKTTFEEAFERIAPALLQSRSFREPAAKVEGFNYRYMASYEYASEDVPEYIQREYSASVGHALNIGKVLREDLIFEDSRSNAGIQVADLLASGLRRCLRGRFQSNHDVAVALGKLTLQNQRGKLPIHLVSFSDAVDADEIASQVVKVLAAESKPMIAQRRPAYPRGKS